MSPLLLLVALCLAAQVFAKNPSRQCRICEDVAQTYHDRYRCAGEAIDQWSPADAPAITACEAPLFSCERLTGAAGQACAQMESAFLADDDILRTIWTSQMEFGSAYRTCAALGKCASESSNTRSPCHATFRGAGKHDPLHSDFAAQCSEECFLCLWITSSWPLFEELCTPLGTAQPNSVDPDRLLVRAAEEEQLRTQDLASAEHQRKAEVLAQAKADRDALVEAQLREAEADRARAEAVELDRLRQERAGRDATDAFEKLQKEATLRAEAIRRRATDAVARAAAARFPREPVAFIESDDSAAEESEDAVDESDEGEEGADEEEGEDNETAFVETATELRSSARSKSKASLRAADAPASSLYASLPDGEFAAGPELGGVDLKSDCMAMWRFFARSRKAKYFTSWKRQLGVAITPADIERSNGWDANVACKCLGQCELDPFEHLGLIKQCRYDEGDRAQMEYAFPEPH